MGDGECTSRGTSLDQTQSQTDYSGCGYSFQAGGWSDWNSHCSGSATHTRSVSCVRSDGSSVSDSECTNRGQSRPASSETAGVYDGCSYYYSVDPWSDWSSHCSSNATRRRNVYCRRSDGAYIDGSNCSSRGVAYPGDTETAGVYDACGYSFQTGGCRTGTRTARAPPPTRVRSSASAPTAARPPTTTAPAGGRAVRRPARRRASTTAAPTTIRWIRGPTGRRTARPTRPTAATSTAVVPTAPTSTARCARARASPIPATPRPPASTTGAPTTTPSTLVRLVVALLVERHPSPQRLLPSFRRRLHRRLGVPEQGGRLSRRHRERRRLRRLRIQRLDRRMELVQQRNAEPQRDLHQVRRRPGRRVPTAGGATSRPRTAPIHREPVRSSGRRSAASAACPDATPCPPASCSGYLDQGVRNCTYVTENYEQDYNYDWYATCRAY